MPRRHTRRRGGYMPDDPRAAATRAAQDAEVRNARILGIQANERQDARERTDRREADRAAERSEALERSMAALASLPPMPPRNPVLSRTDAPGGPVTSWPSESPSRPVSSPSGLQRTARRLDFVECF